jgi:hypothetical protein
LNFELENIVEGRRFRGRERRQEREVKRKLYCAMKGQGESKMTEEKILTKHPLGKSGKNISRSNYDTLKQAILAALQDKELTHTELFEQLDKSLAGKFSGNISWYGETVKLDLEARKIIERTSSKPQKYRIK